MPTAVIAEDEPLLREGLRESLAALWPELHICAEAEDGLQALRVVDAHRPDVIFLDIHMPGLSGMEVARQIGPRCHIVFVTAYDQHAIEAFEQGAVDYVMKPLSTARLATSVGRIRKRLEEAPASLEPVLQKLGPATGREHAYLRWITASQGTNLRLFTVDEICYFQADHKYTMIATATADALIRKPIKELVEELDPAMFWQIHRSTVINANAVAGLKRDMKGRLHVSFKQRPETLPVSESYAGLFRQM